MWVNSQETSTEHENTNKSNAKQNKSGSRETENGGEGGNYGYYKRFTLTSISHTRNKKKAKGTRKNVLK